MHPDGPHAVAVTLVGGPCDGQVVNVFPRGGGIMPYTFEALPPADHWTGDTPTTDDYATYIRDGGPHNSRRYLYLGEVASGAQHHPPA